MNYLRYVLLLVIDPDTGYVVGITKKKGPAFLLNRITFPGGKIEPDEDILVAASREMKEETGIDIPVSDWKLFDVQKEEGYELNKLVAVSSKVLHSRTCEEEPVWHLKISAHQQFAAEQPAQYAPDFLQTLQDALTATNGAPVAA